MSFVLNMNLRTEEWDFGILYSRGGGGGGWGAAVES